MSKICDICNIKEATFKVKTLDKNGSVEYIICDSCYNGEKRPRFIVQAEPILRIETVFKCRRCGKPTTHLLLSAGEICDGCLDKLGV